MNIYIPFNEWSISRIQQGKKTATTRKKKYGEPGDIFIVNGETFRLSRIDRTSLDVVSLCYYAEEGCNSPEEFIEIWEMIHPYRGFIPSDRVWLHIFERDNQ